MADNFFRLMRLLQLVPRAPRFIDTETIETILSQESFKATRRTIQRDLIKLEAMGFGLQCLDDNKPYRWRFKENAEPMMVPGADPQSALALRLAELHLERLLPKSTLRALQPHLQASKRALEGKTLARWLDKVRLIPRTQPLLPPKVDGHVVGVIHEALLDGKQIVGRYRRAGADEATEMLFHPLGLVYRDSVAYLVASVFDYDDARSYAFHRFVHAELVNALARSRPAFDLDQFIASGELGYRIGDELEVALLFSATASKVVEESRLSPQQSVARRSDGQVLVEAVVADTQVFRAWVLSFGPHVEVLKPASLRRAVADAHREASQRYS